MNKLVGFIEAIVICIIGFLLLLFSQQGGSMVADLISLPKEISFVISCLIYILLVVISMTLFNKYILKKKLDLGIFPSLSTTSKWFLLGISLPMILNLLVITLTKGEWIRNNSTSSTLLISFALFGLAVPAGVCEELIFRGFMFDFVNKKLGLVVACILPSFVFALVHILNGGLSITGVVMLLLAGTVVGIMFTMIRIVTGNIWCGIIVHILWDLLCFNQQNTLISLQNNPVPGNSILGYKFSNPSLFVTGGDYGIETSILGIIIYASVASVLIYKYKTKKSSALQDYK